MLGAAGKGEINLICADSFLPEFPNISLGTTKDGKSYFDATNYIAKSATPNKSIHLFFANYKTPIAQLCESYELDPNKICLINQQGHYLIDGTFIFLFITFLEPDFLAYMCDRIYEMFAKGVAVSDTYLLSSCKNRFSPKVIEELLKRGEQ